MGGNYCFIWRGCRHIDLTGAEALAIGLIDTRATNELRVDTRLLDDEGNAASARREFAIAALPIHCLKERWQRLIFALLRQ
jgi:hypothetical protein